MRIDFEKVLNENGLKVGDKVKLENGDICEIRERTINGFVLINDDEDGIDYGLETLGFCDFEKLEPKKKVGDLICKDIACAECPLRCIACKDGPYDTIREKFFATLGAYPELGQMRAYFEAELNKEIE